MLEASRHGLVVNQQQRLRERPPAQLHDMSEQRTSMGIPAGHPVQAFQHEHGARGEQQGVNADEMPVSVDERDVGSRAHGNALQEGARARAAASAG